MNSYFLKSRSVGWVKFLFSNASKASISDAFRSLKITETGDYIDNSMNMISLDAARKSVMMLMWKDLAYKSEIMPRNEAECLSNMFVDFFNNDSVEFYSNGDWSKYYILDTFQNSPITESTFNAVILAIHNDYIACLIIEEED